MNSKLKYLLFLSILFIVIFIYHLHYVSISADTITLLPMAEDILQGNWRLQGWILGTNNFYFTDLIFETLLLKCGVSYENIIYGLGSFDFALLIVSSLYFSKEYVDEENSTQGFLYLIPLSIALLPIMSGGYTLLNLHSHISAYILCIICWVFALKFLSSKQVGYLIAYFIFALLGNFSDAIIKMVLFAPVCSAMLVAIFSKRDGKYCWAVILTNCMAYILSSTILNILNRSNIFLHTIGLPVQIINYHSWSYRFLGYVKELLSLYGYVSDKNLKFVLFNNILLILFVVLVLLSLVYFGIKLAENSISINILLFVALFNICACIITGVDIVNRYIVPFYIFTLILSTKFLHIVISNLNNDTKRIIKVGLVGISVTILVLRISLLPNSNFGTVEKKIASYLQEEHLSGGYGNYWAAPLIWYYTDYSIPIYQVLLPKNAIGFHSFPFLVKDTWWTEKNKDFFIRINTPPESNEIDEETLNKVVGIPKKKTVIGRYTIYEYGYDISKCMIN